MNTQKLTTFYEDNFSPLKCWDNWLPVVQNCATKRQSVQIKRTTVMLTSSNQAEIWFVASHAQNLIPNEISAHLDM